MRETKRPSLRGFLMKLRVGWSDLHYPTSINQISLGNQYWETRRIWKSCFNGLREVRHRFFCENASRYHQRSLAGGSWFAFVFADVFKAKILLFFHSRILASERTSVSSSRPNRLYWACYRYHLPYGKHTFVEIVLTCTAGEVLGISVIM